MRKIPASSDAASSLFFFLFFQKKAEAKRKPGTAAFLAEMSAGSDRRGRAAKPGHLRPRFPLPCRFCGFSAAFFVFLKKVRAGTPRRRRFLTGSLRGMVDGVPANCYLMLLVGGWAEGAVFLQKRRPPQLDAGCPASRPVVSAPAPRAAATGKRRAPQSAPAAKSGRAPRRSRSRNRQTPRAAERNRRVGDNTRRGMPVPATDRSAPAPQPQPQPANAARRRARQPQSQAVPRAAAAAATGKRRSRRARQPHRPAAATPRACGASGRAGRWEELHCRNFWICFPTSPTLRGRKG